MTTQKLFLTFLGTGLNPRYAQLSTAALALLLGLGILLALGAETLFMTTLAVSLIAIFEINKHLNAHLELSREEAIRNVTIDKAAGLWLSMLIAWSAAGSYTFSYAQELALLFSFASFLLFESWQPSTIGWIRRNVKGGLGVVGSTLLSGFAGGFLAIVVMMGVDRIFR